MTMNTTAIENFSNIEANKLDPEFYFTSLLEEALKKSLLTPEELTKIQMQCLQLLATKAKQYAGFDSSSVQIETAEELLTSIQFTIGLHLKSAPSSVSAIQLLKQEPLEDLYRKGYKKVQDKMRVSKHLHAMVLRSLLKTDHYTYRVTVVDGIKGFFMLYNEALYAHKIHITADYPLCNPFQSLAGIEFIEKYLEYIYYENQFLNCFPTDCIHELLQRVHPQYQELVFNIFEAVFTQAIGCILSSAAGIFKVRSLSLSSEDIITLSALFHEKSGEEIQVILEPALHQLMEYLGLEGVQAREYYFQALETVRSNILGFSRINRVDGIFLCNKPLQNEPQILYSLKTKLNNEKYRLLVNEILECRHSSDRLSIIRKNISSLEDLLDIITDGELDSNEIKAVLNPLDIIDKAAILKLCREEYAAPEGESEAAQNLQNYIKSLDKNMQMKIEALVQQLTFHS